LFSFSDALKATNCTFQEVDNIFCLAVGIAVYDEYRKGKASGLENLRPYHRMESMRKSNILSSMYGTKEPEDAHMKLHA
jgi:hypothetical protein